MLTHLRALRATFAAPMAALLALGFLVANPGVSSATEIGDARNLTSAAVLAGQVESTGRGGPADHHPADPGTRHHGSEDMPSDHGYDPHDADHGCEECFCVAAASCAAPAVPAQSDSVIPAPRGHHVHLLRADWVPVRLLHHDIFRPPRAT